MGTAFTRYSGEGPAVSHEDRLRLASAVISAAEIRRGGERDPTPISLGWSSRDDVQTTMMENAGADALRRGAIHEWIGIEPDDATGARTGGHMPLFIMLHAARAALSIDDGLRGAPRTRLVWIGRACWPCPTALGRLLDRSLWIDPPDASSRLWATDLALRCTGVAAVIADGSGLDMAGSRRLQLAAETGGTVGLIARQPRELKALSAAATRWVVSPVPAHSKRPRWTVDQVRCKGARVTREEPRRFVVEWDHAQGNLVVPAELAGRPAEAAGPGAGLAHGHARAAG